MKARRLPLIVVIGVGAGVICVVLAFLLRLGAGVLVMPYLRRRPTGPNITSDLQTIRSQLELYKVQHFEKYPHLDENGNVDTINFVARLLQRTDEDGRMNAAGAFGPYLQQFPCNGCARSRQREVKFGIGPPPGDGTSGWYFDLGRGSFHANDPDHKDL